MKFNFWIAFLPGRRSSSAPPTTLWMYKRVIFGEVANKQVAELSDANARELLVLGLLADRRAVAGACIPAPFTGSCTRRSTICSSTSR